MRNYFLAFLLLVNTLYVFGQSFDNYFENKSLRVDFYLYGNEKDTHASFSQMKKEPFWGGTKSRLIFPDKGTYRIQIFDSKTDTLLFSKGFNSLFEEWQHTPEAKENTRMFYHTQQIPFPKQEIKWVLQKRNHDGNFDTLLSKNINPNNKFILKEISTPYPVKNLLHSGNPNEKLDIAVIAEGYTQSEQEKFYADAQRMVDYLFQIEPFSKLKNRFNIYAIASVSLDSGTDEPSKNSYKNTIVNSGFDTFDIPRYLTTQDQKSVADIASLVPYDQMYVLVNTNAYGGGAFYNHLNLTSANHPQSERVFVHELGHGLVGLADEYYDSSTTFNDLYNLEIEPWEPNITTLANFDKKWKKMIDKNTPIPTPRTPKYQNKTGAFEGGGYVTKGIFSPMQECMMKTLQTPDFCPVCQKAIIETIIFLSE